MRDRHPDRPPGTPSRPPGTPSRLAVRHARHAATRSMRFGGTAVVALLVIGPALRAAAAPGSGAPPNPWAYRPPVAAPVVDGFRPPAQPWLPGNRGLAYATRPGMLVRAIGPGLVTFAGPVAGSLHVTVAHPDGLRSSYSFLAAVRVPVGARVAGGEVVGVAGPTLHLGVRRGDRYLDPARLWGRRVPADRVALVPLDGGGAAVPTGPGPPSDLAPPTPAARGTRGSGGVDGFPGLRPATGARLGATVVAVGGELVEALPVEWIG